MVPGFVNRCSYASLRLICFEGWLYIYVMAFCHMDSEVMSVDVVKSQLLGFIVAVIIFMCSAGTGIQISRIIFFYCLLTIIAKVQSVDRKASFLFVGDVNAHHEEWLGSSMMNHGRAARHFASSSGCEQMVTECTHIDGGLFALVLTDVLNVVWVWVGSPVRT